MKQFNKTYCAIRLPNKDIKIIASYAMGCNAHFTYCYNSISGGYMGLQIDTFLSSLRGLLRVFPDFTEVMDEHQYEKGFKELGFTETQASESDTKLYQSLYH